MSPIWINSLTITNTLGYISIFTNSNVNIAVGSSSRYAFSAGSDVWFDNSVGFGNTIIFNSVAVGGTNVYITVGEYGYGASVKITLDPRKL